MLGSLVAEQARLQRDLESLAQFGRVGPTAVTRLAFTPEDNAAHRYVQKLMHDAGLRTYRDTFGNVFGRREGRYAQTSPVITGSHLDGPPNGGLYDGTAGVVCALEAVRLLNASHISTQAAVEVAAIRCEHLDRFGMSCLGSRAMSGKLTEEHLDELRDDNGISLRQAVRSAGGDPERLRSAFRNPKTFLELHIEQGRVLEDRGKNLGVVTAIAGPTRFSVRLRGVADHSGGTPMNLRRDAFCGTAELALILERLARATEECVGTIGVVKVKPGAMHTIPGEAEFLVDIRGTRAEEKRGMVAEFRKAIAELSLRRGLEVSLEELLDEDPVPMSSRVIESVCRSLDEVGFSFIKMPSGGGHDAQHMAAVSDAGMLFIPSARGISHTPEEYTFPKDLAIGATALARCLVDLADNEE